MRVLFFEQITDDRFDKDIYSLLDERVKRLRILLDLEGLEVSVSNIEQIDFGSNNQCRCKFYVRKSSKNITWNDVYRIVNSVNAVSYRFV